MVDFLLVLAAISLGCNVAASRIVEERKIYLRERLANLRMDAYLISKVLPLMLFTAVQVAVLTILAWIFGDTAGSLILRFLALSMAAWNGMGIGLLISSAALSLNKAMSAVSLIMIPQIVLAGFLVAVPEMNMATDILSLATTARWAMRACEIAALNEREIDEPLLSGPDLRSLQNLYASAALDTQDWRDLFMAQRAGQRIHLGRTYKESIAVMAWLLALLGAGTLIMLRRLDIPK